MEEQTILGQEVVVSASRVEESILKSPVTIEKLDLLTIRQTPAADFFDALSECKGSSIYVKQLKFSSNQYTWFCHDRQCAFCTNGRWN